MEASRFSYPETHRHLHRSETPIRDTDPSDERLALQLEQTHQALQRDITERRRAQDKPRESEERFRELAETIQEVFSFALRRPPWTRRYFGFGSNLSKHSSSSWRSMGLVRCASIPASRLTLLSPTIA